MKFISMIFGLIAFCCSANYLTAEGEPREDLSSMALVIPSCDKYEETWEPLFTLLFRHWPELKSPVYLISNTKTYRDPRVTTLLMQEEKDWHGWSDNFIKALRQIKEKYLMIIMTDFMITAPVNHQRVVNLLEQMIKEKAAYLQLSEPYLAVPGTPHPTLPHLFYKPKEMPYRTSLKIAIWRKDVLEHILKSGETAWDFEMAGSIRSRDIEDPFMMIIDDFPLHYIDSIAKGHWRPLAVAYLESQGFKLKGDLPIESSARRWFMGGPIREFASTYFAQPVKKILKDWFGIENVYFTPRCLW